MNKRIIVSISFLLLLSTYSLHDNLNFVEKFNIKKIIINNNVIVSDKEIFENLNFLYKSNLFFLKTEKLNQKLKKIDFIESVEIKKIYPNKIIIKIFEKTPIAILQIKKNKFYYTDKNELINFKKVKNFENLPIVFGEKENFNVLYKNLKKINFPISSVKTFYYFESNRWDLVTYKKQIIKLPIKNYEKSLKSFMETSNRESFRKYLIFDYRINDQLILK